MADLTNDFSKQRLLQLVDARCNGALDERDAEELEAILAASPEARAAYWAALEIHSGLEWELSSSENWESAAERFLSGRETGGGTAVASASSIGDRGRRVLILRMGLPLGLAACLFIGIAIGLRGPWSFLDATALKASRAPVAGLPAAEDVLGRLTALSPNSRWSFGRPSDRNSPDVLPGDTVSIDTGAVSLRLRNNVVAQMKAPLVLSVNSTEQVRLLHGRIQVDVPKGAEGFTVETATAEILDLGTSFSVEVIDGGTDLIVHQGEVDLILPEGERTDQESGPAVKRFRGGEAVRVHADSTLSRIVNVQATDMAATDAELSARSLVKSVRDNIVRDDMWSFYEIVPGGLGEDARAFVDRSHEWNGATDKGLPEYLAGADYIKTFNDDKVTPELVIELELARPAEVYVFLDKRLTPPAWLVEQFSESGEIIGIDESHDEVTVKAEVGSGKSIDQTFSIWRYVARQGGVVRLGPNGDPPPHEAEDILYVPSNMYGIAVVRLP